MIPSKNSSALVTRAGRRGGGGRDGGCGRRDGGYGGSRGGGCGRGRGPPRRCNCCGMNGHTEDYYWNK